MKFLGLLLLAFALQAFAADLPNAPSVHKQLEMAAVPKGCYRSPRDGATMCPMTQDALLDLAPPKAGFFTFRKSWRDAPLRTNREQFHSKLFLLSYGCLWAAVTTDIATTHGARESWDSEIPAVAGATVFGYIADRFFTRSYMVGGAVYGVQHYVRDAFKGR